MCPKGKPSSTVTPHHPPVAKTRHAPCISASYRVILAPMRHATAPSRTVALLFVMQGMMEKIPMTRAGFTALDEELRQLKSVERGAVIRAIAEAREHGDLSENAEYHAAREKQSFIEGRIKELEAIVSLAEVIDPTKLSGTVKFGATVTLVDEDSGDQKTYQIVGEPEADIENGRLNIKSPLARALIGKDEGDSVEVRTPGGQRGYEVLTIRFI
jgi:transcription elongation factor GreA